MLTRIFEFLAKGAFVSQTASVDVSADTPETVHTPTERSDKVTRFVEKNGEKLAIVSDRKKGNVSTVLVLGPAAMALGYEKE